MKDVWLVIRGYYYHSYMGDIIHGVGATFLTSRIFLESQRVSWSRLGGFSCQSLVLIPVVPHKAVAEVSNIGDYRRGDLL